MALWLLCCVLLFVTSRGYVWLSHQNWFLAPELSLPWLVLGGLGLAIASNRHAWSEVLTQLPSTSNRSSKASASQPSTLEKLTADAMTASPTVPKEISHRQSSISFKIPVTKATTPSSQADTHRS